MCKCVGFLCLFLGSFSFCLAQLQWNSFSFILLHFLIFILLSLRSLVFFFPNERQKVSRSGSGWIGGGNKLGVEGGETVFSMDDHV